MLYVAWKGGLPRKFARLVLFCSFRKCSCNLLCVLDLFSECWQSTLFQIFFLSNVKDYAVENKTHADIKHEWEKVVIALISTILLIKYHGRWEWGWWHMVCYDVWNTSCAVCLPLVNDSMFWTIRTCALYLGVPYWQKFSFSRQIFGGTLYMQKHFVAWKLMYSWILWVSEGMWPVLQCCFEDFWFWGLGLVS